MKLTKTRKTVFAIILTCILFFVTGCKSKTVLVPVDRVKIEYRDRLRVDSVYNRDTVELYRQNDTIYKNVIRWRERFRLDTLSVVKVDSIPYPVEVVREVNKLTKWQSFRLKILNILVLVVVAYVVIKIKF